MENIKFWETWPKSFRYLYLTVLTVFGGSVVFFIVYFLLGAGSVIEWESLVQPAYVDLLLEKVKAYPFSLEVNTESIVFYEWFGGSDLNMNLLATWLYLIFFCVALVLLLSVATTLSKFWYYVSIALFAVLLINFKLELLLLFGNDDRLALILALVLYLPASFYFHTINKNKSLTFRIAIFSLITILLAVVIALTAGVKNPFLYMAA
ncbi:MAG: hypothetical protein OEY51_08770, partial [Cyclobacteriaceae bacterium]|nr:hypothetical protein [Cyclobacteriaceae bacterium]